jgi:hypothetical protein
MGSGVPKICNAYEETVAKRTPDTDFSPKDAKHSNKPLIEAFIETGLKIKELSIKIPFQL